MTHDVSPLLPGGWSHLMSLHAGQVAALAIGAAAVVVVSRLLGPERYGTLTLFLAASHYAVVLCVNWTTAAVVRFGRDEFVRTGTVRDVFWARLAIIAPCVGCAGAAVWFAREPIAAWIGFQTLTVPLLLAMIVALTLADQVDGVLQAASQWNRFAWLGAIEKATFIAGIAGLVIVGGTRSVQAAIIVAIVSQLTRVGIGLVSIVRSSIATGPTIHGDTVKRLLSYSWPLSLTFTIGYLSAFVEPFVIKAYLATEHVGIYQVALQISLFIAALFSPVSTMMFPAVTSMRVQQREDLIARLLRGVVPQLVFACSLLLVVAMGVIATIFPLVVGPEFSAGLSALLILLAATAFQLVTMLYSPILSAFDLTKESAAINTLGGIIAHLLPVLVLTAVWGINGAAGSWLIWYVFSSAACVWIVNRRIPGGPYSTIVYPAIALCGSAILLLIDRPLLHWPVLIVLIAGALAWARHTRLFREADLTILDATGVPVPLRRMAARACAFL